MNRRIPETSECVSEENKSQRCHFFSASIYARTARGFLRGEVLALVFNDGVSSKLTASNNFFFTPSIAHPPEEVQRKAVKVIDILFFFFFVRHFSRDGVQYWFPLLSKASIPREVEELIAEASHSINSQKIYLAASPKGIPFFFGVLTRSMMRNLRIPLLCWWSCLPSAQSILRKKIAFGVHCP